MCNQCTGKNNVLHSYFIMKKIYSNIIQPVSTIPFLSNRDLFKGHISSASNSHGFKPNTNTEIKLNVLPNECKTRSSVVKHQVLDLFFLLFQVVFIFSRIASS